MLSHISSCIIIFIGGGLGAVSRFLLSSLVGVYTRGVFPWGTLTVNLLGALLIGLFVELAALKFLVFNQYKLFCITGFLGGFTTFSAFSLESTLMLQEGQYLILASYVIISVFGTIAAIIIAKSFVGFIF